MSSSKSLLRCRPIDRGLGPRVTTPHIAEVSSIDAPARALTKTCLRPSPSCGRGRIIPFLLLLHLRIVRLGKDLRIIGHLQPLFTFAIAHIFYESPRPRSTPSSGSPPFAKPYRCAALAMRRSLCQLSVSRPPPRLDATLGLRALIRIHPLLRVQFAGACSI